MQQLLYFLGILYIRCARKKKGTDLYKKIGEDVTETSNVDNSVNIDRIGQKLFRGCEN